MQIDEQLAPVEPPESFNYITYYAVPPCALWKSPPKPNFFRRNLKISVRLLQVPWVFQISKTAAVRERMQAGLGTKRIFDICHFLLAGRVVVNVILSIYSVHIICVVHSLMRACGSVNW